MWRNALNKAQTRVDGSPAQRVCILGSTGSIGTQTLDVVRLYPDRLKVDALTAMSNVEKLAEQIREFMPRVAVIGDEACRRHLVDLIGDLPVEVLVGEEGMCKVAADDEVDTVVASVVGFAGLPAVLAALDAGKRVALANKETLVVAGELVTRTLERNGGVILPVDSEHSAIFQCLVGEDGQQIEELILTASGGPFRTRPASTFADITLKEALDHPNWSMGAKITVDSASMMNKGLEVIEAHWLFGIPADRIRVLVHPQSIIHSMVSFSDGSTKAQLGVPDMKVPIQYALTFPDRWPAPHPRIDWATTSALEFEAPDSERFPCLGLAYEALRRGGTAPAVLNAANEEAVALFLQEEIRFIDIPELIDRCLTATARADATSESLSIEALVEADQSARRYVRERAANIGTHTPVAD